MGAVDRFSFTCCVHQILLANERTASGYCARLAQAMVAFYVVLACGAFNFGRKSCRLESEKFEHLIFYNMMHF